MCFRDYGTKDHEAELCLRPLSAELEHYGASWPRKTRSGNSQGFDPVPFCNYPLFALGLSGC